MKKITYTLAAIFASAFALTSCTKEMTDSSKDIESQGIPFEICASVSQTRTTTDNSWNTTWVAKDAINLFHAKAGTTTYVSDGQFTVENTESGKFKGKLAGELTADSYDWYAFYPYKQQISSPGQQTDGYTYIGHSVAAIQNGNNDRQHLGTTLCPLYGISKSLKASAPVAIEMQQLTSVVEIVVKNTTTEPLTVTSIAFSTDEDIVGSYYINFAGENVVYTPKDGYTKTVANLTVNNGTALNQNETASFFIPIKPHVANSGSTITLTVNGYEKTKELTSDVTFAAGKIKRFSFDFDKATEKIIYSTEFNYSIVTTNGQTGYTNSDEYIGQDEGKTTSWGIIYGNWNGSNCGQMRVYKAGNFGSLYMKFDVSKATKISYKAKVNNAKLKLNTYYSTDSGENWIKVDADKDLTTTLSEYSFTISETGEYDKNRVKFEVTGTAPSKDNYQLTIDDVTIFGDGEVVEPKLTKLATPSTLIAGLSSSSPNSIEVVWDAVENAGSYVVTATTSTGSAVVKEVTTASHTFIGLEYNTEYTISVYAKSSDPSVYSDSDVATYDDTITTGAKPESGGEESKVYLSEDFASLTKWGTSSKTSFVLTSGTWTASGSVYEQKGCIKIGKSSNASNSITTPALSSISGTADVVLTFKAVSSDFGYTMSVVANNAGTVGTLSPSSITKHSTAINNGSATADALTEAFAASTATFTVTITGATSATTLTIKTSDSSKRWYLDDVKVVSAN